MTIRRAVLVAGLLLAAGCGEAGFTEADEGATREVERGEAFRISLPASPSDAPRQAHLEGAFLQLTGRQVDLARGREIFEFTAEGVGDAEIRLRAPGAASGSPGEFVLRVRIRPATAYQPYGVPGPSKK